MWVSKKKLTKLYEEIETLKDHVNCIEVCSVCGCVVAGYMAVKGKGVIYNKPVWRPWPLSYMDEVEYVHYPYYCKVHAPKEEESKEEEPEPAKQKEWRGVLWGIDGESFVKLDSGFDMRRLGEVVKVKSMD